MARLFTSGFELNSLTADMEWTATSGQASIVTSPVRSGGYAGRINATSAQNGVFQRIIHASDVNTIGYQRLYIYVVSYPGATAFVTRFYATAGAGVSSIRMATNGTLLLFNAAGAQVGSASSAVPLNTWTMVELKHDATTNPGAIEGRLNGVSFASGANSSQGSWARIQLWQTTNAAVDIYYDDVAVNDNSGSAQTGYPGPGKVICLRPTAAGDSTGWTPSTGSNFAAVDETPPNDVTDYVSTSTLNAEDYYTLNTPNLSMWDTISVVSAGARFRNDSASATQAFTLGIKKAPSGTISASSNIIPNSTTWQTNATASPKRDPVILYTDPDGNAWTPDEIGTMQVGIKETVDAATNLQVSAVWVTVEYVPSKVKQNVNVFTGAAITRASTW